MKISALSDIHYPMNRTRLDNAIPEMYDSDVIVVAGDITHNAEHYAHILRKFGQLPATKIAVLGNHDLYTVNGSSLSKIEFLAKICRENNFHLLDASPLVVDGVGFVGNIGWYDYEFAQTDIEGDVLVHNDHKVHRKRIDEVGEEDFEAKRFTVNERTYEWNDRNYIKWEFSDKEFLHLQLERLAKDLETASKSADKIVYVSHHVPIWEFVQVKDDPQWCIFNAYQGSPRLGKIASSNPKTRVIICGHSHLSGYVEVDGVDCYDVSHEFGELETKEITI